MNKSTSEQVNKLTSQVKKKRGFTDNLYGQDGSRKPGPRQRACVLVSVVSWCGEDRAVLTLILGITLDEVL